jgi:hypothetical protein
MKNKKSQTILDVVDKAAMDYARFYVQLNGEEGVSDVIAGYHAGANFLLDYLRNQHLLCHPSNKGDVHAHD